VTDRQITYLVVGGSAIISFAAWVAFIAVPAWTSYWRTRERVVALLLSVWVLAAFVMAGALVGALVLWHYDQL
jgi:hypothetical protein